MARHPHDRLNWVAPGESLGAVRSVVERAFARDVELRAVRTVLSASALRGREFKTRPYRNTARTSPNAPLLKRVVKYPYAMTCERPVRHPSGRLLAEARPEREPVRNPVRVFREAMGVIPWGGPLAGLELHLSPRQPRPSVDAWLKGRS